MNLYILSGQVIKNQKSIQLLLKNHYSKSPKIDAVVQQKLRAIT